jgi:putative serine protease PepD
MPSASEFAPSGARNRWRPVTRSARQTALTAALAGVCAAAIAACASDKDAAAPDHVRAAPSAAALQRQFVDVVRAASPAVVQIQTARGLGSGIVFDRHGDILTNAHVVGSARRFLVTLAGGARHRAQLVGTDPQSDVAVVRLVGATPKPATFADSSRVHVGDLALALGNPLGLRSSVTEGIVSSLGRSVSEGDGVTLPSAIQTSAAINPGNSGGALVDLSGQVIGIPTLAALDPDLGGAQAPGIGFAIPSNTARRTARELIRSGQTAPAGPAYLGVDVATLLTGGVGVGRVLPGGPAARAGIQAGDLIVAVAGQQTPSAGALESVLATLRPGQRVALQLVTPGGDAETVNVVLGRAPGS